MVKVNLALLGGLSEQIKLQVALINPLIHVKGPAAPETKTAAERAHLLIEQAEALGEPPKTLAFCSPSSTSSAPRTAYRSMAMRCASLQRNS